MILYESTHDSGASDHAALRGHLLQDLSSLYSREEEPPACLGDLAAAISSLCQSELNLRAVPDGLLALLGSKALWSVGERNAAGRMLSRCGRGAEDRAVLQSLYEVEPGGPSLALCLLMAAGHVKPSRCSLFAAGPVWALDVARPLDSKDVGLMELGLCRRLGLVLDVLVGVWDVSRGRGVLDLRGWSQLGAWADAAVREEAFAHCRRLLARAAQKRGWAAPPEVRRLEVGCGS